MQALGLEMMEDLLRKVGMMDQVATFVRDMDYWGVRIWGPDWNWEARR